jgi:hypothetical protein
LAQFVADVDLNFVFPRGNYEVCLKRGVALPAGTPFTIRDEDVNAFDDFGRTRIDGFRWLEAADIVGDVAAEAVIAEIAEGPSLVDLDDLVDELNAGAA